MGYRQTKKGPCPVGELPCQQSCSACALILQSASTTAANMCRFYKQVAKQHVCWDTGFASLLIIFYEGRNFQGRHWECSSDCTDTFKHFNCCNSIRVSGGHWVAYEKPHHMGYQYILGPGEYADYHSWMGYNNCVRSCQMYPPYRGSYKMRIYNRSDMMGHTMEFMDDCPNLYDRFRYRDIYSCNIMEGFWIFYEHPNYRGRQYFLRPGEYRACNDWGCHNPTVGSFRRMRTVM
ncbi:Gamma-crystallin M2 [Liparis tanakae]|uniref:Gamma-crystallin M2 n=1 Tax=Liparis tanakae TaxID=230148 RepID=A0A4Z2GMM8_9TELE|nr:Gamma-crystallin M2 [Liparis tanakae]